MSQAEKVRPSGGTGARSSEYSDGAGATGGRASIGSSSQEPPLLLEAAASKVREGCRRAGASCGWRRSCRATAATARCFAATGVEVLRRCRGAALALTAPIRFCIASYLGGQEA